MLGQTEYGMWYHINICKLGKWETLQELDGGDRRFYNLAIAKNIAKSWKLHPGIEAVMVIKVECSVVYDLVTHNRMMHTVYTGITEL